MLSLRDNFGRIARNMDDNYLRFDYNIISHCLVSTTGPIRYKSLDHAMLPFFINDINVKQSTFCYDEECADDPASLLDYVFENINELTTNVADNVLQIIRIYTPQINTIVSRLDQDLFTSVPDAVRTLYNTCMNQATARGDINAANIVVKKCKINHTLIMIMDKQDFAQASDMFLTIGLVPVIFSDWKDKFNEEEINYFASLVKRSQIKRISNVAPSETFNIMCKCTKYKELESKENTKYVVTSIVRQKVETCRRMLQDAEQQARDVLQRYNAVLDIYYKKNKEYAQLCENQDSVIEEVRTAISIPCVYKVDTERYGEEQLLLYIKANLSFFELDEVECVIKNVNKDTLFYKFLDIFFIQQKYKLMLGHIFKYDFSDNRYFDPNNIDQMDILKEMGCHMNPHLTRYSCLGDYKPILVKANKENDLVTFINVAVASLKSINFKDGVVINTWKETINRMDRDKNEWDYNTIQMATTKCVIDDEGNEYSLEEILLPDETTIEETLEGTPTIEVEDL